MHLRKRKATKIASKDKTIKLCWPVAVKHAINLDISFLKEEESYLMR